VELLLMYFRDYSLHISLTDWLVCVVQNASFFCYVTGESHKHCYKLTRKQQFFSFVEFLSYRTAVTFHYWYVRGYALK